MTSLRRVECPGCESAKARIAELESAHHSTWKAKHDVLWGALETISGIRDSIVGSQQINWSEHIYPLVAALKLAGFDGAGYEISKKNYGTMFERVTAAEARVAELEAKLGLLLNPGDRCPTCQYIVPNLFGCVRCNPGPLQERLEASLVTVEEQKEEIRQLEAEVRELQAALREQGAAK